MIGVFMIGMGLLLLIPLGVSVGLVSFGLLFGAPGLPRMETLGDWSAVLAGLCFFALGPLAIWSGFQLVLGREESTQPPAHLNLSYRVGRTCGAFVRKVLPNAKRYI
jgi:hypothetical protein